MGGVAPSKNRPTGTEDAARTRDSLTGLRPDLVDGYDTSLPGARAAVLSRLLGAFDREPLPGVRTRHNDGRTLRVTLTDGRVLTAAADAARPFAGPAPGLTVRLTGDTPGEAYTDPGALLRALALPGHTARLATEVDNSVANLALARAANAQATNARVANARAANAPGGDAAARDLAGIEQAVTDGHPLHPCCRTRGGMTVADVLAYAPEHHPVLRLRRLRVPPGHWYGGTEPVLLAHPWQADRLRAVYPWLSDDGETGPVRPLMSLRTVAPLDGGDHVKTAVDVQLTSAVRTVSPAAVHNGPVLSRLLRELTRDLPLDVLAETGAGAVIVDGQPQRHLAHLRRQAPTLGPGETALPLAALDPVLDRAVGDPYAWVEALATVLVPPLLTVLRRGVALEAHGQNTLVVLAGGRPVRILYRDLGGVRVSARRLHAAGFEAPPLHGDLPSDDPDVLRTKLAAALFGTVAAQLVAVLEHRRGADPARLWRIIAGRATTTEDGRHLMRQPLPVKATTAMRLADDPLDDRWAHTGNPMAAYA
jgi:siderophore synthetase component